jgi:hypothetical protein
MRLIQGKKNKMYTLTNFTYSIVKMLQSKKKHKIILTSISYFQLSSIGFK